MMAWTPRGRRGKTSLFDDVVFCVFLVVFAFAAELGLIWLAEFVSGAR